ncbi:MAG: ribonuclease P protein component [Bacteroidales bacterium]
MSTMKKHERLASQKKISYLAKEGNTFFSYPFRVLWCVDRNEENSPFRIQAAFSVPKKKFKKAVKRNVIRRRTKEAFRLNKEPFKQEMKNFPLTLYLLIIFAPKKELDYSTIEEGMINSFEMLKKHIVRKTE